MKKKLVAVLLCVAMACSAVGCGKTGDNNNTENNTQTGSSQDSETVKGNGLASMEMNINAKNQVSGLCAYEGIEISIPTMYELNETNTNALLSDLLTAYGIGFTKVSDRTVVEENDIVDVNYTGYLNGEAFEGGAATGVMIDIANNRDAESSYGGYIPGFTSGLPGATVGSTIQCDVTFPENYSNEELKGQAVVFEFTINGIYEPATFDTVSEEDLVKVFGENLGITNREELREFVEQYLTTSQYSAIVNAVKEHIVTNSTIDIPEEYLAARLKEYEDSYEKMYCSEGQTLNDYFMMYYGLTLEQAEAELTQALKEQIGVELAFAVIAEERAIEMNEEEYNEFIQTFIDSSSYSFENAADVYNYFGADNSAHGEKYLRDLYLVNKAIDFVSENAVVTFAD